MLATGGLSHWLDPGKFGGVDVEFDTYLLQMLQAGRGLDVSARWSPIRCSTTASTSSSIG